MASYQYMPSVSTTTRSPYAPAIPGLNQAMGGALDAYNTTFQGPQIAGMDENVTAGQNAILGNSGQGLTTQGATNALQSLGGVMGQGGLSDYQRQGADQMQSGFNTLDNVQNNLNPYASGAYMSQGNPYLERVIQNSMSDAAQGVNAQFSAAGRYGSGAQSDALSNRLGRIATDARFNDYYQQQQNQLGANNALMNLAGQRGGLGGQLAGIGQQGIGNMMNSGAAFGALNQAQNMDANNQIGVGSSRMDYEQAKIDAANSAPWERVSRLANISQGVGGMGGTSTTMSMTPQEKQEQPSTLSRIAGYGLAGAGMFKNIFR
jgi:hypothetical protein